jgi:protein-S-isoprenylcysteine O-methyltransferase Ste14
MLWFVMLIVLPIAISIVEVKLGVQRFPGFPVLSATLLGLFSLLGLWAALAIAIAGRGTPFRWDEARRLVYAGPYAYMRNPFWIAMIGQGAAIVLALGSYPVAIYVLALFLWMHFYARPREERHLNDRYGVQWMQYKQHVRAYVPRLTAYHPA